MGNKMSLEDHLIEFKLVSKQLQRSAKKCESNEKSAIEKLKKAIKQNNTESARIYGQDAIREKNQRLNHLRMASRIDAVSSRIESAVRMGQVTKSMQGVVKGMDVGLKTMNIEQLSLTMDKFERQFEDLDVRTGYMDDAMNSTTVTSTPADQVDDLIKLTAEKNNMELGDEFAEAGVIPSKKPQVEVPKEEEEEKQSVALSATDDLEARLNNLRK